MSDPAPEVDGERVLIEFEWYDGPRSGIAEVAGTPSYFLTDNFVEPPEQVTYLTWPVPADVLPLEMEAWQIFVDWNDEYEAGRSSSAEHPGHGGVNARQDELETLLAHHRNPPSSAARRRAMWIAREATGSRYCAEGLAYYGVRWQIDT